MFKARRKKFSSSDLRSECCIIVLVTHLYALESVEPIFLIEDDRVLKQHGGLSEVLDGDGDGDGGGDGICLQVDVLLAVCPQQVRSQQGEPA